MAVNVNLLIMAPVLQDYLVDKDTGAPMSAGVITLYQDNDRQLLKNWYYQTGTVGNYTFIALDNPLTLSSAGTITDPNGNDVIPFFYPFDEDDENTIQPYFITVDNSNGERQFTRENFPYIPNGPTPFNDVPTLENIIWNNVFYHNVGSIDLTNTLNAILAPSQHDGFMAANMNDIRFVKSKVGAADTITFTKFPANDDPLRGDITPEYYLNFKCSGATTGETRKSVQIPITLHTQTLENQPFTFTIQAQNVAGNSNNVITVRILQYYGTGGPTQNFFPIGTGTINLTTSWHKYEINSFFPPSSIVANSAGDDGFFLDIGFPLNVACEINLTRPSIYLSEEVPTNDFKTYDVIDTVINSPRTGDIRISINDFSPFGWILCNDGVISMASTVLNPITPPTGIPTARANIDTWNLYSLIWSNVNSAVSPIYPSTGGAVPVARGASAIDDWNARKQLQLTKTLGRALLGLPPLVSITYDRATTPSWGQTSPVAGVFQLTFGTNELLYVGAPVYLTGTMPAGGPFIANTIYYAIPPVDGDLTPPKNTLFQLANSYANSLLGNAIAAGASADNGSNLVVNYALGGTIGQARHVQLINELSTHHHNGANQFILTTSGSAAAGGSGRGAQAIGNTGNSYPFNIVQPSTYLNVMLKL